MFLLNRLPIDSRRSPLPRDSRTLIHHVMTIEELTQTQQHIPGKSIQQFSGAAKIAGLSVEAYGSHPVIKYSVVRHRNSIIMARPASGSRDIGDKGRCGGP